jgi:MFS transporter, UMF1 family
MRKKPESFRCGFLGVASWCLFDWAHSAFPTVITTFIFSTFFVKAVSSNKIIGTEHWSWALSTCGVIVAILAPILGSISDKAHRRKPWIFVLMMITVIATALLYFTQPNPSWVWWAVIFYIIANVSYECAQVFYNALMIGIAPNSKIGRLSGWGWGTGYIGGIICLFIALYFVKGSLIPKVDSIDVRATCLLASAWFLVFGLPLFFFTPDLMITKSTKSIGRVIREGLVSLWETLKEAKKNKYVFLYLIAHLVYADGLNTLFTFGGIYAAGQFNMSFVNILYFGICMNITAGIGAIVFSWIDDYVGSKFTIMLSIICLIILSSLILLVHKELYFWIIGMTLSIFVGPMQAASRSYMAHVAPPKKVSQFFGLYALSGRVTAFMGPLLVGVLTMLFKSQRAGMSSIVIMLVIGLILMFFVPKEQK